LYAVFQVETGAAVHAGNHHRLADAVVVVLKPAVAVAQKLATNKFSNTNWINKFAAKLIIMTKTAVVILNWNGRKFLEQFLPSVTTHSTAAGTEIWVADNGSTDDSISFLKHNYPQVRTLQFDQNYGFTGGYNRALQQIEAKYFVLLNSDVEVTPNWLEPMVDYMDSNLEVAACMPKLLAYNDKSHFEYAGAAGGFIDKYGFPFCRGRIFGQVESDNGQYNEVLDIFWATGACMFVRSSVYNSLGGLDSDFFAHMEEIDLCWRMRNQGYRIVVLPKSVVYHVGGGTLPNNNPRKLFLNYRNNLFMLYKNLPTEGMYRTIITRMLLDGLSVVMYLLQFKFRFAWAVPRAHFDFYKNVKTLRRKRDLLQCVRKMDKHAEQYKHSIVAEYYLRRVRCFSQLKKEMFTV